MTSYFLPGVPFQRPLFPWAIYSAGIWLNDGIYGMIGGFPPDPLQKVSIGGVPQSTISIWFLWASALALGVSYLLASWLVSGKFGSVIRAIRDDEARVRFLGYSVEGYKLFVFTLTAVAAAIAGALYYPQAGIINPAELAPIASIYLAVWVAIGGRLKKC